MKKNTYTQTQHEWTKSLFAFKRFNGIVSRSLSLSTFEDEEGVVYIQNRRYGFSFNFVGYRWATYVERRLGVYR